MLLLDEQRRTLKAAISLASTLVRCSPLRSHCCWLADAHPRWRPYGSIRSADWPAPFGIVLVLDRLSALMLLLDERPRPRRAGVLARALASRRAALPHPVPVPADGPERRLPDRRPVQSVRLLRGAAGRLLRPCAARLRHRARQGRAALHRDQPRGLAAVPDRRQPDLRRHRHAQHGRSRRAHSGGRRRGPSAARGRRGGARHRLPGQGGHVAARLLAADHLCRRGAAGRRDVRRS